MGDLLPNWSAETWGALSVLGTLVIIFLNFYIIYLRRIYDKPQTDLSVQTGLKSKSIIFKNNQEKLRIESPLKVNIICNITPRNKPYCTLKGGRLIFDPPLNIGHRHEIDIEDILVDPSADEDVSPDGTTVPAVKALPFLVEATSPAPLYAEFKIHDARAATGSFRVEIDLEDSGTVFSSRKQIPVSEEVLSLSGINPNSWWFWLRSYFPLRIRYLIPPKNPLYR